VLENNMSSLGRLLSILDLYSESKPIWTLEDITLETGFARSTAYRYVKELCDSGLLMSIGKGAHVLGPRFIELDRLIRNNDPLLMASQRIMPDLLEEFGEGVLLLSSLYGNKVLCIHQEPLVTDFKISYTRGRPMPLFYGATSKIILCHLPEKVLIKLFLQHRKEIAQAGLGEEWDDFRASLSMIRQKKFCISSNEVDQGVTGVGTAIFSETQSILGSLTYVTFNSNKSIDEKITGHLLAGCEKITKEINSTINKVSDNQ
tara:strand:- start:290 stop:1069 length:780 start_codon:yes stop_codon:yes gene_type:complete